MKHSQPQVIEKRASIVPTVRYRDVPAAITWLCDAFGFEAHRVVKDNQGSILYAQLTFGNGMVMVAPIQETAFGKLMVQPDEIGGVETQICYLHVEDADAHQARAAAAGADIVLDIQTEVGTGRGYSYRDPEGHIWNFGTYDPWEHRASPSPSRQASHRSMRALAVAAMLVAAGYVLYAQGFAGTAARDLGLAAYTKVAATLESARAADPEDEAANKSLALLLGDARDQLAKEQVARMAAEQHLGELRDELAQVRRATYGQEELMHTRLALNITSKKLEQALAGKEAAERSLEQTRALLAQLHSAKEAFEKAAKEEREQFLRRRAARMAAVRAAVARRNAAPIRSPDSPF